jgi:hypothetical protein
MKYFGLLIALFSALNSFSQSSSDLIGIWQIEKVITSTNSSVNNCKGVTKYKLIFNLDNTYSLDAGPGFITTGKWKVEENKFL